MMKIISQPLIGALAFAVFASSASAAVIVNDDFEYADLAAMQANWGTPAGMSLTNVAGNVTQAGWHDGSAAAHQWVGSTFSVTPTASDPIVLSADIWYSGNNNQRNTIGLRNGANPLFEMGFFNSVNVGLGMRVVAFGGNESWIQAVPYTTLGTSAQWIRLEATFTGTSVSLKYDLNADGSVEGTLSSTGTAPANPFTDLRFGGPSSVVSAGGGFAVDNISLAVVPVPEPSTVALGLLGGAGLMFGYFRRRAK